MRCEKPEAVGALIGAQRVCIRDITALPDPPGLSGVPGVPRLPGVAAAPRASRPWVSRVPVAYTQPAQTPFRDVRIGPGSQRMDFEVVSGKRR
jgi:hypothetical protein